MDSLTDYIGWMKDFPISATGFRDADAMVFCALSYLDLFPVCGDGQTACVRECRRMIDDGTAHVVITGKGSQYLEVIRAAVQSRRFGDLLMTDYTDRFLEEIPLQFSAVTFHDESGAFIAFRGTDDSLAGWREDFMISFSHTRAQELAKEYAEKLICPGRQWRMGGHSKGGNLALYAACTISDEKLDRLERVFLLDSPGLCPEVIDLKCMSRVSDKATRILPEFSVIGELFEAELPDLRIVQSSAKGFLQHNLATWGIDHGSLALARESDPVSRWINEVLDKWIRNITREERIVFVDEVFDALSAGGAKTMDELVAEGWEGYSQINPRLRHASETTKRILADLPKQAVISGLPDLLRRRQTEQSEPEDK